MLKTIHLFFNFLEKTRTLLVVILNHCIAFATKKQPRIRSRVDLMKLLYLAISISFS